MAGPISKIVKLKVPSMYASAASTAPSESDPTAAIKRAMADFFRSGEYSDLKVTCGPDTYHVHKAFLCGQCDFFKNACKKNGLMEGEEGMINFPQEEPAIVKAMLEYLYTFDYDGSSRGDTEIITHAKVYSIADRYNIQPLKVLACVNFTKSAERMVNSMVNGRFFSEAIRKVYCTTPDTDRGLRDIVIRLSRQHLPKLLKDEDFVDTLTEVGELGRDLVIAMAPNDFRKPPTPDSDEDSGFAHFD